MHGQEKTDPIGRLKTRHNGILFERDWAASFGSFL